MLCRQAISARLVLLDWDTEKVYETYKSKGINTPYTGKKLTGSPKAIVTGTKDYRIKPEKGPERVPF